MDNTAFRKQQKIEDTTDIWVELDQIGRKYGGVSLGWGLPYLEPPEFLIKNMTDAIREGYNHYTEANGHQEALRLLAEYYSPLFNRTLDPKTEVIVTNGANGALGNLLQALVSNEEDEVIMFEPTFPEYMSLCQYARGTSRFVPIKPQEDDSWKIDTECLKDTLNEKSRVIIFNFPHNPTCKVPSYEELKEISDILSEYPKWVVICDNSSDYLTFDGHKHYDFATIDDNWNKTVTTYSGGKLLCWTGWRVGWAIGPKEILKEATVINVISTYGINVPGQIALARSLKTAFSEEYKDGQTFVEFMRDDFKKTLNKLVEGIKETGLPVKTLPVPGGYFVLMDVSGLRDLIPQKYFKQEEYEEDKETVIPKVNFGDPVPLDLAVSRWLAYEKKVVTMPGSFFYSKNSKNKTDKYVRMAFCRGNKVIDIALQNLKS